MNLKTFSANMSKKSEPIIKPADSKDFTRITFKPGTLCPQISHPTPLPDLARFNMQEITTDMLSLLRKRVYDIAGTTRGIRVHFNNSPVPIRNFLDYARAHLPRDENTPPVLAVHRSDRWTVIATVSPHGQFHQSSFVNSICTVKGGTHVNHVTDQIVARLAEHLRKNRPQGVGVKPFAIKAHLSVFVNCMCAHARANLVVRVCVCVCRYDRESEFR